MGLFRRLFGRKKKTGKYDDDWEEIVYDREDVNFDNEEERSRYITNCLEQIADASKEIHLLTGEYEQVTAELSDTEEIEALPGQQKEAIEGIVQSLHRLEQECAEYKNPAGRMDNALFMRMKSREDEVPEGIEKLTECEKYGALVRQDMKRLDRERHAYEYRRTELNMMLDNFRGMTIIVLTAFGVCMLLLCILQFGFRMETRLGMLITLGTVAVAITVMVVRYMDSDRELARVLGTIQKLIQLQNKVKIRYVNNSKLREYLCVKYNTKNAAALAADWEKYCREKENRRQLTQAEAKIEGYREELLTMLKQFRIRNPQKWLTRSQALIEHNEMVEIRHDLILQRQALRKQIEYNTQVAQVARKEIMDIADKYPAYAGEILNMVDRYDTGY